MQLSPHFTLAELIRSDTATRKGIRNVPTRAQVAALTALCEHVLEPVRAHFGRPVRVTSGFRAPAVCVAIGGSTSSQHTRGEAADFEIPGVPNLDVARWIRDTLTFDQLILEFYTRGQPNSGWVHCSYRVDRARHDVLTFAGRRYLKGLVA
ncbi:MAG TPA: D-Ala-D-Ala carboxypeptidase family metallohydrolase [Croceibacterium sp.]|nr:D-Ala-D-Ala carboxypeptidase family metallohydrolase [Croceibacterium sp.]